ncbi:hypothetical protein P692DRAFT_201464185 [Suillus brevipes Sb2]|nr:hypothetical protein P692DRAFT_201464185 [Suillus brevipes Sb2]
MKNNTQALPKMPLREPFPCAGNSGLEPVGLKMFVDHRKTKGNLTASIVTPQVNRNAALTLELYASSSVFPCTYLRCRHERPGDFLHGQHRKKLSLTPRTMTQFRTQIESCCGPSRHCTTNVTRVPILNGPRHQ